MKKSTWLQPYKQSSTGKYKVNLPLEYPGKHKIAGVYMIKSNRTGKIVYIGSSKSQLIKTILRHFQEWNDTKQERHVYKDKMAYKVQFTITTPSKAEILEAILVREHKPPHNKAKFETFTLSTRSQEVYDRWLTQKILKRSDLEEAPF